MELFKFIISAARRAFFWAMLSGVCAGLSMVTLLALTNHALHKPDAINSAIIASYFLLIVVVVVARVISTVLLSRLSQDSIAHMRMRLSRQILASPLVNLERYGPHKLLASLSSDITSISTGITRLPFLLMNVVVLTGCLFYLMWMSLWLFVIVSTLIGVGILAYRWPQRKALQFLKQARDHDDHLYKGFRAVCEGTKELKMNQPRRKAFFAGDFYDSIKGYGDAMVEGRKYYSFAGSFGILLLFIVIGVLVFFIPKWIEIELSTLIAYVLVLLFMKGPLEGLMTVMPELAKTSVSLRKIQSLGLQLSENQDPSTSAELLLENKQTQVKEENAVERLAYQHTLKLDQVTHSYYRELEANHFQLGPINLEFKPGELVFLIGGNGSGKTTLAKMLLGLYIPESGQITIDGNKLIPTDYEAYRQLFTAVFVDFFLFEELTNTRGVDVDKKANYYLEKLQLNHKVTVTNGKLSTTQLSQGQKKRLTLISAYLDDRPFYVFDEWAADQDPEFKSVFYREILPDLKQQGKTVLVISHDEQYFDIADRHIKMDFGQLVEMTDQPKVEKIA